MPTNIATMGATDGNIIAAIITTHVETKNAKVPSALPGPESMPDIRRSDTTQASTASAHRTTYVAIRHGRGGASAARPFSFDWVAE